MNLVLLFVMLLVVSFLVLLYFFKPTQVESAVKRQLERIETGGPATLPAVTILKPQRPAATPWESHFVQQIPGSTAIARLVKQSGKQWPVTQLLLGSLVATVIAAWVISLFAPTPIAVLLALAVGSCPYIYLYVVRQMKFSRCDALLPEAVDLLARALRAGHATSSALEMIGQEIPDPLGSEFRVMHEEQSLGLPSREAILNLVDRVPTDDMRFLTTAILVQSETGGNLTQILDKTAAVMRERARLRGQLKIYTAQGRITGWILCAMPFIMFGLISLVNPGYEKVLLTDETGLHVVYIGLIMMVAGVLIIRKIIDVEV